LTAIDELRALPPPLARAVLERIAAEHGAEVVLALARIDGLADVAPAPAAPRPRRAPRTTK
jgi:hypothetical protein